MIDIKQTEPVKPSRYNFIVSLSERTGSILLYNFRTNALLKVSGKAADAVCNMIVKPDKAEALGESLTGELKKGGFLVNQELDELKALKIGDRRARFNTSKYSITIAPTLACNFNCPYCYQAHLPRTMTAKTVRNLKRFVDCIIFERGIKYLSVSWYGGEPLLEKNLLLDIQSYFYEQCLKNDVVYKSGLVTNGYLLDAGIAKELSERGNNFVQITLDGTREFHDRRRALKNGGPTFDRIYENLKASAQFFERITLRVNVDKENPYAFESIVEMLDGDGLIPTIQPYPAQVDALTEVCNHISPKCLSPEEFAELEVETGKNLLDRGKDFASYPSLGIGCGGICDNAMVIDPEGYLYKCWNDVGVIDKSVGCLGVDSVEFNDKVFNWVGYDLFEIEECRECRFLPHCLANCHYEAITNKDIEKRCTSLRYNLEFILKMKYVNEIQKQGVKCNGRKRTGEPI